MASKKIQKALRGCTVLKKNKLLQKDGFSVVKIAVYVENLEKYSWSLHSGTQQVSKALEYNDRPRSTPDKATSSLQDAE